MAHSRTEYASKQKGDAGLRFESFLVNKPSFFLVRRGRGLLRRKSNNRLIRERQDTGSLDEGRSFFLIDGFEFFITTNQL
jgi:hypothetical protein